MNVKNFIKASKNDVIKGSKRAVCGAFEREIVVKTPRVASMKKHLKSRGFIIVGTGPAGFGSTKIWFNPAGVNL